MTTRSTSLRDCLRAATREAHEQFDAAFRPSLPSWSPGHYATLLTLLHSLHASADPLLATWQGATWQGATAGFPPVPARTAPFLADLTVLGIRPGTPLDLGDLPHDGPGQVTQPAAFGLLYVVAGSSLGGRTVLKLLPPTMAPSARNGLSACGSQPATAVWQATLALLAAPRSAADTNEAIDAARLVFTKLLERLAPLAAVAAP